MNTTHQMKTTTEAAWELLTTYTDETIWAVQDALTGEFQNPSTIGRKAKLDTHTAWLILQAMTETQQAVAAGNGAWKKYRARKAGEVAR